MIDQGLPAEWPPEVIEAAKLFEQGDLVESPSLGYAADLRYPIWDITRQEAEATDDPGDEQVHLALEADDRPLFGIVTSQTCDVAEDRDVPLIPWFEFAPVYSVPEDSRTRLRDFAFELPEGFRPIAGHRWIADLRIEFPLEKSVLVGRIRIRPFETEEQQIEFGRFVGNRRARAALSESIHTLITSTIRERRGNSGKRRRLREGIFQFRLAIEEGRRLDPRAVKLHVITVGDPTAEIKEWVADWWSDVQPIAREQGIELLPPAVYSCERVDLREFLALIELRSPLV